MDAARIEFTGDGSFLAYVESEKEGREKEYGPYEIPRDFKTYISLPQRVQAGLDLEYSGHKPWDDHGHMAWGHIAIAAGALIFFALIFYMNMK